MRFGGAGLLLCVLAVGPRPAAAHVTSTSYLSLEIGGRQLQVEWEIAVRDIAAGDQLTCEYATLYPTVPMECRCGSPGCRGGVGLDDLVALWPELDRKGAAALTSARSVPQPLLPFVRDAGRFLDWVDGRADRPSFRHGSTGILRAERTG